MSRMFIDRSAKRQTDLQRGKSPGEARRSHSTLRQRRDIFSGGFYEHFVPASLVVLVVAALFAGCGRESTPTASSNNPVVATTPLNTSVAEPQGQNIDFSKFYHDNANHARLPCLLCHRRENAEARPTLPGGNKHLPCTGCHAQEFANSASPVCTICHTNSKSGTLKPFPPLRSFNMLFDHARHLKLGRVSCATCHQPGRGGVAMTIPAGLSAHVTCYQCHGPQAKSGDRDISSCGTCHQLGDYSRTSTLAAAFKDGFSHAKHGGAQKLSCSECHSVRAGQLQRQQVTAPLPLNHHAPAGVKSCASCHTGKRAFGGDDFSACTRCHRGPQWHF